MSNKRLPSALPVVKNHLKRAADFIWSKILRDPRSHINKEWNFDYLMRIVWIGMLTGKLTLRRLEDFSEGYNERVPDTTLHDLIVKIDAEPLRELIAREVKKAHRAHELPKEELPFHMIAIDGKCVSVSKIPVGKFSQESECNGGVQYVNRVLRAAHVSSKTKMILGQREIFGKTNEVGEFKNFFDELYDSYKNTTLLEVLSVDAGMNSKDNADYIIEKNCNYIMGLKNPQKKLVEIGQELLGKRETPDKATVEQANGKIVRRELYRCEAPEYPGWPHLKEFWRIHQVTEESDGKEAVEDRYYITSINLSVLSNEQVMKAIRLHWGIENNVNWIFDVAWKEDVSPWCNRGLVLVSLLRILAYNILSRLYTRRLRKKEARERSYKGIMTLIYTVLVNRHEGVFSIQEIPAFI